MADAVEAAGQHVEKKAADELVRVKPHGLPAARTVDAIVFPAEGDAGVVGRDEAAVRDGDPVGVAGQIAQHLLRSGERRLAVDDPLDAPQRGEEALERGLVGEPGMRVEERQLAGVVRIREHGQHLAAEETRQQVDVHEEVGAGRRPIATPSSDSPPPGTIMCTCG